MRSVTVHGDVLSDAVDVPGQYRIVVYAEFFFDDQVRFLADLKFVFFRDHHELLLAGDGVVRTTGQTDTT